jgi:hypothetical protein
MVNVLNLIKTLFPILMPFILYFGSSYIDAENPLHRSICIYSFLVSTGSIALAFLYIRNKITGANDQHKVKVEIKADPWNPEELAKEEEEKKKLKPGQKLPVRYREVTTVEYDLEKWNTHFRMKFLMPLAITFFIFRQFGYLVPLLLQAVMLPQQQWSCELVQVHLLGRPATGDLARPWKDLTPMEEMSQKFGFGGGSSSSGSSSGKKKLK